MTILRPARNSFPVNSLMARCAAANVRAARGHSPVALPEGSKCMRTDSSTVKEVNIIIQKREEVLFESHLTTILRHGWAQFLNRYSHTLGSKSKSYGKSIEVNVTNRITADM